MMGFEHFYYAQMLLEILFGVSCRGSQVYFNGFTGTMRPMFVGNFVQKSRALGNGM